MATIRPTVVYSQKYGSQAVYVGPAPATGYTFVTSRGVLNNNYTDLSNNFNLLRPIQRVNAFNYEINFERTEVRQLGTRGNVAMPIITPPTVNLSMSYLQFGIINELRMGFYVNYPNSLSGINSGSPVYSDNFGVCCISGFVSKELNPGNNDFGYPFDYRDKRNIFLAINRSGLDIHGDNGYGNPNSLDVVGFGNCYITSYKAAGGVGTFPQVTVNYIAENLNYYTSGSGANIPAVNPVDLSEYSNSFVIPPNYEGSGLISVLLPGDTTLDFEAIRPIQNILAIPGTGKNGKGNLALYSEDVTAWNKNSNAHVISGNVTTSPFGELTADAYTLTGAGSSFGVRISANNLVSGKRYEASVYLKANTVNSGSFGIFNSDANAFFNLANFNFASNTVSSDNTMPSVNPAVSIQDAGNGWFKCSHFITPQSGSNSLLFVYPRSVGNQMSGDSVFIWGAQVKEVAWEDGYVKTTDVPTTGESRINDIVNIGVKFDSLSVTNYSLGMDFQRQPLVSLTHKLPLDRKVTFPVYCNLDVGILVNVNQSGKLLDLLNKDNDYNLSLKLRNPIQKRGVGVQYDFKRAKLNNINYGLTIGENKVCNLSFITELNPDNLDRGLFMSGSLNVTNIDVLQGYLLKEDGGGILLENGAHILAGNSVLLY